MSYKSSSSTGSYAGRRTITAFFDDRGEADRAVEKLVAAGIGRSDVRVVEGGDSTSTSTSGSSTGEGGGFWDSLTDLFLPDEDRHTYAEGLRRGGYLVTVTTDANYETALEILDDDGTIDIGEREGSWRSEGWSGYAGGTPGASSTRATGSALSGGGYHGSATTLSDTTGGEEVIPVVEEQLRVGKRDVSHGRVRVRSYVVETPVSEEVTLREENVTIQRRPVDRPLTAGDRLFEDRTIDMEERAEEAVVAKEARIREEIVVNKQVDQRTKTVSDTVRSTEVEIEDERDATRSGVSKQKTR